MEFLTAQLQRARKFDLYSDPGHAWAKIPLTLLGDLGLLGKISSYSYFSGSHAFLEEDCDLALFVDAYRAKFGQVPQFREHVAQNYSRVRNYQPFNLESILAALEYIKLEIEGV